MKYNADHPFIRKFLQRTWEVGKVESELAKEYVELLLISLGQWKLTRKVSVKQKLSANSDKTGVRSLPQLLE